MESEFLSKYGNEDNFDEDKMTEDILTIMLQIGLKEKKMSEIIEKCKNEKNVDIVMEYFQKRKNLVDEYIKKIKQMEEENENND